MDIKILSHRTPTAGRMMFTNVIRFQPQTNDDRADYPYEDSLNRICSWISLNFEENFVILEKTRHRIAGGWADNKKGWQIQKYKVDRMEHSTTAVYELRCMGADATLFMLKWAK